MKNHKGFTLIEVLIVVVIIAVLASLIAPRMIGQTRKAKAAEALQMVGVIKRAAERYRDLTGNYLQGSITSMISEAPGNWSALGLKNFSSKDWNYFYVYHPVDDGGPGFTAYAYEDASGVTNEIDYDGPSDTWNCEGVFRYKDEADHTKGCVV